MSDEIRQGVLDACLQLSADALAIFDAVEADEITVDTARSVVGMGKRSNEIALGVKTLVVLGWPVRS